LKYNTSMKLKVLDITKNIPSGNESQLIKQRIQQKPLLLNQRMLRKSINEYQSDKIVPTHDPSSSKHVINEV